MPMNNIFLEYAGETTDRYCISRASSDQEVVFGRQVMESFYFVLDARNERIGLVNKLYTALDRASMLFGILRMRFTRD